MTLFVLKATKPFNFDGYVPKKSNQLFAVFKKNNLLSQEKNNLMWPTIITFKVKLLTKPIILCIFYLILRLHFI